MFTRYLIAGLCVVAGTVPALAQAPAAADTVPFQLLPSRHILVKAELNGKGPFNFIFDTGAPINLVSSRVAQKAGLKKSGGFSLFSGPKPIIVKQFELGPVTAAHIPVLVMDHPTVETISQAFEEKVGVIEGIIGYPFFARYAMTVDYQKRQLRLQPNGHEPGDYLGDLIGRITELSTTANQAKITAPAAVWGLEVRPSQGKVAGIIVQAVVPKSPAARAGLQQDDRILTIDGRWADTVEDVFRAVSLVKPGRTVDVQIERGGKPQTISVTPKMGL